MSARCGATARRCGDCRRRSPSRPHARLRRCLLHQKLASFDRAFAGGDVDHEAAQRARPLVVADHVDDVLKPHEATVGGQPSVFKLIVDGG
jgi:hypothetical protein